MGRTGAFALLYAAVQEVEAGNRLPELPQLVRRMRQQRKHMLQEKVRVLGAGLGTCPGVTGALQLTRPHVLLQLHLRFCHEAVVRHVEQVLQRHGVPPPCRPLAGTSIGQKVRKEKSCWDSHSLWDPIFTYFDLFRTTFLRTPRTWSSVGTCPSAPSKPQLPSSASGLLRAWIPQLPACQAL